MKKEDKRFKLERIEKLKEEMSFSRKTLLISVSMLASGTAILANNPNIDTALIFTGLFGLGFLGYSGSSYALFENYVEKKSTFKELEGQGIDVQKELKIRKRTK